MSGSSWSSIWPPSPPAGERVAERTGQLVEHRRAEKELAYVIRLVVQHLLDEVVQDEPVAAGERFDEVLDRASCAVPATVAVPAHGQSGELQASGPSFGAGFEGGNVRRARAPSPG